jgi:hypothetical protein
VDQVEEMQAVDEDIEKETRFHIAKKTKQWGRKLIFRGRGGQKIHTPLAWCLYLLGSGDYTGLTDLH